MDDGCVELPSTGQGTTEVVVGDIGIVGLEFQRPPVMGDGRIRLSSPLQGDPKVLVGIGIVGLDFQRLLKMGDGLVNLSLLRQGETKVVVGITKLGLSSSAF